MIRDNCKEVRGDRIGERTLAGKSIVRYTERTMPWDTFQAFIFDTIPDQPRPWLIGISGGMDSSALLDLAHRFRTEVNPEQKIIAVHLNHGLRENATAGDEEFCRRMCEARDIPFRSERIDITALAREASTGIEETGRNARRRLFVRIANECKPAFIFLAHHADDQVETILMNFLRGADLRGLSGMDPVTTIRIDAGLGILVRPLLTLSRADLEAYAQSRNLTWCEDETNRDTRFTRNRIRHEALPMLESIRPGLRRRLLLLAENFSATDHMLDGLMLVAFEQIVRPEKGGYVIGGLDEDEGYPTVWLRVVDHVVQRFRSGGGMNAAGFARVLNLWEGGRVGAQVLLAGGVRVRLESDGLFVSKNSPGDESAQGDDEILLPEDVPFTITADGMTITAAFINLTEGYTIPQADTCDARVEWLDADSLSFPLLLRGRRPGDRMQALGAPGTKKLKDLLIGWKVPQRHKADMRVVCDSAGIVWAWPHRIAAHVRLTSVSRTALRLSITKVADGA